MLYISVLKTLDLILLVESYVVYCFDASVTLGKLAFFHSPRGGKAIKGKQISLENKCMLVDNPCRKVATFVSLCCTLQ